MDAGVGRKREVEGSGVSGRAYLGAHQEILPRVRLQPPLGCRSPPEPGRYRAGCAGGEPGSWVGPAPGASPAGRDNPPGTSPIPTPLSFLGAWRAGASPINFIFLLICSPFRNSGSIDLSLPPSKKYSVSHPAETGRRQPGMLPPGRASPRGG